MDKKHKIRMDRKTIMAYGKKLRAQTKQYVKQATAYTTGGRKNRALTVGECCLQLLEELYKLDAEKKLDPRTLMWMIRQTHVRDTDGKKGYRYDVFFWVNSDEKLHTEEEIVKELRETYRRLREETEEMYGEVTDEEYLEEDSL